MAIPKSVSFKREKMEWAENYADENKISFSTVIDRALEKFMTMENGDSLESLKLKVNEQMKIKEGAETKIEQAMNKIKDRVEREKLGIVEQEKTTEEMIKEHEKTQKDRDRRKIDIIKSLEGLEELNQHLKEKQKDYDPNFISDMVLPLRDKNPTQMKMIDEHSLNLYAKHMTDKTTLTGFVSSFLKPTPKPERIDKKSIDSLDKIDKIINVLAKAKQEGNILQKEDFDKAYDILCKDNPTCIIDYEELKTFLEGKFKEIEVEK